MAVPPHILLMAAFIPNEAHNTFIVFFLPLFLIEENQETPLFKYIYMHNSNECMYN